MYISFLRRRGLPFHGVRSLSTSIASVQVRAEGERAQGFVLPTKTFSERLGELREIGLREIRHPFHSELVEGTLCQKKFRKFVVQNLFYIEESLKLMEIGSRRFAEYREFFEVLKGSLERELERCKDLHVYFEVEDLDVVVSSGCEEYIQFLKGVMEKGGIEEIVGALLPCYLIFREMYFVNMKEMGALRSEHPYYFFLKHYEKVPVSKTGEAVKKVMIEVLSVGEERLEEAILRVFCSALMCEKRFFDGCYKSLDSG